MVQVLRAADRPPSRSRTIRFEGAAYGAGISFFAVDNDPGQGPGLHVHPYAEIWVVRSGNARFVADGVEANVGPGDIVIVEAGVAHKFTNIGPGRLDVVCIHDAGTMMQTDIAE